MTTVTIDYKPNARQSQFHACGAQQVVYGGAKGGGKSCALVMEALAYGYEHPGAQIYLFRKTYDDLESNLIREAKEKWPAELYSYNESKHIARLKSGSTVYFRYIGNYDDAYGYMGRSIDFIGVDELTQHEERSIQVLLSCLRSPKGFPPVFRATCNPGDIGHAWVKKRYIQATDYGKHETRDPVTDKRIAFIPAKVTDNTVLMQNDPDYEKRLNDLPEQIRKAYRDGDWDVFMGQAFSEWRQDVHVVDPFEIPSHWKWYRTLDEGYSDPFVCLWIVEDDKGFAYVVRELVQSQLLTHQQIDETKRLSGPEKVQYSVADTSFWNTGKQSGESPAELFARAGVPLLQATKERVNGWRRVRDWLHVFDDADPVSGETFKNSRLKVFRNCVHTIEAIPAMVMDDTNLEDCAEHPLDHVPDTIRYWCMSRPQPAHIDPVRKPLTEWDLVGPDTEFDAQFDPTMGAWY